MSSLTEQIEAEDSSHSLLSRRQSDEIGSHYITESGVYMSSFAATIFVAALVTTGVLMLTLLVALTFMLNSCQSRNSGIIEQFKTDDKHDYCNAFAFHADLNNLEAKDFPTICYHDSHQYSNVVKFLRDSNLTVQLAESYFSTIKTNNDCMDIILMDIDDILLSSIIGGSTTTQDWAKRFEHQHTASLIVLRLFLKLQASGWPLVIFTRKHSSYRNETVKSLISAGYVGWFSLIMRSDEELSRESWEYLSGHRLHLFEQGYHVASIISSQMDAFRGSYVGVRNFKLANPKYYTI